jgi:hypothetical protein
MILVRHISSFRDSFFEQKRLQMEAEFREGQQRKLAKNIRRALLKFGKAKKYRTIKTVRK